MGGWPATRKTTSSAMSAATRGTSCSIVPANQSCTSWRIACSSVCMRDLSRVFGPSGSTTILCNGREARGTVKCAAKNCMHQILVYGDSLTWGIIPDSRNRFVFAERWPGVLENGLNASGLRVRIIEDCLNGRRTVWEDPFKPGRNGLQGLAQRIEINSPLSLVILMLGTNDFQFSHPYNNAWAAPQGMRAVASEVRKPPTEPGMTVPPILIVCPPLIRSPKGSIAPKFRGAEQR